MTVITSLAGMPMVQTGSASTPPRLGHTASPSDSYGFAPALRRIAQAYRLSLFFHAAEIRACCRMESG